MTPIQRQTRRNRCCIACFIFTDPDYTLTALLHIHLWLDVLGRVKQGIIGLLLIAIRSAAMPSLKEAQSWFV